MKKALPYLLFFVSLSSLHASLFDDYLDTKNLTPLHQEHNDLFKKHPHKDGLFENARLNIEHSNFDQLEKKYAIRAYAKKPGSVQSEKRQYTLQKKYVQKMQNWDHNTQLQERYSILIEALKQHNVLKLLQEQILLEQKTLQILASYVHNDQDILKLETIKNKIAKLKLQYTKTDQSYINQLQNIQYYLQNPNITIDTIKNEIQNITHINSQKFINFMTNTPLPLDLKNNITLLKKEYSLNLAKERLQTLKDQKKIGVDNFELEYDDGKQNKNALSFGLSFNIPLDTDRSKMIKEKLKLSSAQESLIESQDTLNQKILILKNKIEYDINYLTLLEQELKKDTFKSSVNKIDFYTLKFLFHQKSQKIEIKKSTIDTLYNLKEHYLSLLYLTKNINNPQFRQLILNR